MSKIQEEVFETADNDIESEEKKSLDDVKSAEDKHVIDVAVNPSIAFQTFAGKMYDPTQHASKKMIQYYESTYNEDPKFESPLQKFNRIKYEIEEFEKDLNIMHNKAAQANNNSSFIKDLNKELSSLWNNVEEIKNNPKLMPLFQNININNQQMLEHVEFNYLMKRLQEYQASQSIDGKQQKNADDEKENNDKAVFTLYYDGNINHKSHHLNEIEQRLLKLEKIIGRHQNINNNNDKNANITTFNANNNNNNNNNDNNDNNNAGNINGLVNGNMMTTIEYLTKRLELLSDDLRLDALVRRAKTLKTSLSELQFKKQSMMEDQITKAKEEKINKMFEMMSRWDTAAQQLPTIVNRLRSLKNLHHESADVISKINNLASQQALIENLLDDNNKILTQVNQSLTENSKIMQGNVQEIENRIQNLQNKITKV